VMRLGLRNRITQRKEVRREKSRRNSIIKLILRKRLRLSKIINKMMQKNNLVNIIIKDNLEEAAKLRRNQVNRLLFKVKNMLQLKIRTKHKLQSPLHLVITLKFNRRTKMSRL
jgi:hypothetical protein